ncbi:prolyl 4-hydroxylase subunit alpha-1-like [Oppia nitens]|uniref:prolyl 4-hydroxylase subunit alpha-1-like n=1 Tax=Oppia nitens TaxID=1686743 RepID=UPI0023D9F811|nr:prolyl 4-hydroxylase subunit alpha-1-like [Oppia nitens]
MSTESTIIEESQWIQTVEKYITDEEHRLSQLKSTIDGLKQYNQLAVNDSDAYLSHPINIYLLIKRLATEWPQVDKLLDQPTHNKLRLRVNPIENNELTEAAKGLQNLVNTYQLDIQSLANGSVRFWSVSDGRVMTIQPSDDTHRLTAADCYLIGKQTFIAGDYQNAIQWFNETNKQIYNVNIMSDKLFESKVAKYMALAYYRLGDYNQSVHYMNKSNELVDYPSDTDILFNQLFVDLIVNNKSTANSLSNKTLTNQLSETRQQHYNQLDVQSQQLCRGLVVDNKHMNRTVRESRLTCRYLDTTNRPLLRLTRVKVEQLYDKPGIVMFHDILGPIELAVLKLLARAQLSRLMIANNNRKTGIVSDIRLAQGCWISDRIHPIVERISRRIGAITGVNINGSEQFNVIKYGVGGYYRNHYDVNVVKPYYSEQYGLPVNRMATWISYLSDVQAGGATVFPRLNLRVEPKQGSALFWYNLRSSGLVDWDMLHNGCPVLVGPAKWIATKWINYTEQVFHKPCLLDKQSFNLI